MNKLNFFSILVAIVALSTSCKSGQDDAVNEADSINAAKYKASPIKIIVEKSDAEFIVLAASISMDEIALGSLAKQKGQDRRIKNLGAIMTQDHEKLLDKITALALAKNITLPSRVGSNELKLIGKLSKRNGRDFDKAYIRYMTDDHNRDTKVFEKILKKSFDADVKSLASKNLPMLHAHLDAINTLYQSIK